MSTGRQVWREMKRAQRAIPLAGATCRRCGTGERLQRHHRNRNRADNRRRNVRILCAACHCAVHIRARDWACQKKMKVQ